LWIASARGLIGSFRLPLAEALTEAARRSLRADLISLSASR
jgi:hypothetical protein